MNHWIDLSSRSVFLLKGPNVMAWINGLITGFIPLDSHESEILKGYYACFLSPSGKLIADAFFVPFWSPPKNSRESMTYLLMDVATKSVNDLMETLEKALFLHPDICISSLQRKLAVFSALGPNVEHLSFSNQAKSPKEIQLFLNHYLENGPKESPGILLGYQDPRHSSMGLRFFVPQEYHHVLPSVCLRGNCENTYHHHRYRLGIPEGAQDITPSRYGIVHYGFQHLNAISLDKGCYVGQESISRALYRQEFKTNLMSLSLIEGVFPPAGNALWLKSENGLEDIGLMAGSQGGMGLALISQKWLEKSNLHSLNSQQSPDTTGVFHLLAKPPQPEEAGLPLDSQETQKLLNHSSKIHACEKNFLNFYATIQKPAIFEKHIPCKNV